MTNEWMPYYPCLDCGFDCKVVVIPKEDLCRRYLIYLKQLEAQKELLDWLIKKANEGIDCNGQETYSVELSTLQSMKAQLEEK
jgi:hypothetical protein